MSVAVAGQAVVLAWSLSGCELRESALGNPPSFGLFRPTPHLQPNGYKSLIGILRNFFWGVGGTTQGWRNLVRIKKI